MREPRQLTEIESAGALHELNRALQEASRGVNAPSVPVYTVATRPTAAAAGQGAIILVSDGGAGSIFQGSDGTNWLSLG
jgi:hypothetical protein